MLCAWHLRSLSLLSDVRLERLHGLIEPIKETSINGKASNKLRHVTNLGRYMLDIYSRHKNLTMYWSLWNLCCNRPQIYWSFLHRNTLLDDKPKPQLASKGIFTHFSLKCARCSHFTLNPCISGEIQVCWFHCIWTCISGEMLCSCE